MVDNALKKAQKIKYICAFWREMAKGNRVPHWDMVARALGHGMKVRRSAIVKRWMEYGGDRFFQATRKMSSGKFCRLVYWEHRIVNQILFLQCRHGKKQSYAVRPSIDLVCSLMNNLFDLHYEIEWRWCAKALICNVPDYQHLVVTVSRGIWSTIEWQIQW